MGLLTKIFGSYSDRELKLIKPKVDRIEALRPQMMELTQEQMRAKTQEFKDRLAKGHRSGTGLGADRGGSGTRRIFREDRHLRADLLGRRYRS